MKKIFLFLAAAGMMAVACNKSEVRLDLPENDAAGQITLRAVASTATKGAELTGTQLTRKYSIFAVASQKSASGLIENSDFFGGEKEFVNGLPIVPNDPENNADTPVDAKTPWHASTPLYWPIGGVRMDFLAYAMPTADHGSAAAGAWAATFDNPYTDISSSVTFNNVDTYANQVDLLYAAKQNQTSADNGWDNQNPAQKSVDMKFSHAQALLIFNLKMDAQAVAAQFKIDEISFLSNEKVAEIRTVQAGNAAWEAERAAAFAEIDADDETYADAKSAAKTAWETANPAPASVSELDDEDVTLKTVGTFQVDNSLVDLVASWKSAVSDKANYKMPSGVAAVSASNSGTGAPEKALDYGLVEDIAGDAVAAATNYQLGETLLVPQQEKVNFVIKYTYGGKTLYYINNDVRGVWEMGKKYIYNLDVALREIVITESVFDFDANVSAVNLN